MSMTYLHIPETYASMHNYVESVQRACLDVGNNIMYNYRVQSMHYYSKYMNDCHVTKYHVQSIY